MNLSVLFSRLKGKYLSDDGKSVDYQGLRNDDLFVEFESHVDQLYYVDLSKLNQAQLKSFFISITVSIVIRLQDCFNKHYLFWFLLFSSSRCLQHTNNSWIVQMWSIAQFSNRCQQFLEIHCIHYQWIGIFSRCYRAWSSQG